MKSIKKADGLLQKLCSAVNGSLKVYLIRAAAFVLMLCVLLFCCTSCGNEYSYDPLEGVETIEFTDSVGRTVEVPAEITRIAPSGATAEMILMTIAPEYLVGLSSSPSTEMRKYYPEEMWYLPTFGQLYGSKSTMNLESLISAQPQIIIDLGNEKTTSSSDMNSVQKQTGIPTVFIEADLENMAEAYRTLGKLLGKEERAEELATYIEETLAMAEENSAQISEEDVLTVLYGTGTSGLACNASGSIQSEVIDVVGCENAIQVSAYEVVDSGGGTEVSLEEVYTLDPDVIILGQPGPYDTLADSEWSELTAVKNGRYYEIPNEPYDWMSSPPSVNKVLGIWWLGAVCYPEIYDYDMVEVATEFYDLFWNYELSEEEALEFMANSVYKQ